MVVTKTFSNQAVFSDDMIYRYLLEYRWDQDKGRVLFIMLNPSTADAQKPDPTVQRCTNFAHAWGFGAVEVANLFAIRATNPRKMISHPDPIGPQNDGFIKSAIEQSDLIVAAWGNISNKTRFKLRSRKVLELIEKDVYCLAITKEGEPSHPLYLSGELKPILYRGKDGAV